MDCFDCLSIWTAGGFACALGRTSRERAVLWPALSAGAIILERMTPAPPAVYIEDEGEENVLWEQQAAVVRN